MAHSTHMIGYISPAVPHFALFVCLSVSNTRQTLLHPQFR